MPGSAQHHTPPALAWHQYARSRNEWKKHTSLLRKNIRQPYCQAQSAPCILMEIDCSQWKCVSSTGTRFCLFIKQSWPICESVTSGSRLEGGPISIHLFDSTILVLLPLSGVEKGKKIQRGYDECIHVRYVERRTLLNENIWEQKKHIMAEEEHLTGKGRR